MSSSALPEAACQLDSRYWKITTSDGNVEEVQGPGVVGTQPASCDRLMLDQLTPPDPTQSVCVCLCARAGEFPIMRPGKVHEYASCTTFSTPSEYMEGHYTFHRLGESPNSDMLARKRDIGRSLFFFLLHLRAGSSFDKPCDSLIRHCAVIPPAVSWGQCPSTLKPTPCDCLFLWQPARRKFSRWPSHASTWSAPPSESRWAER